MEDSLIKIAIAFIGGGVINTTILGYLFFRMVSIDRQVAEIKVHLAYIRKELDYQGGREVTEPELPR